MDDMERPSEADGPSAEAVRQAVDGLERIVARPDVIKEDALRRLILSCLQDLRNALDGKIPGMTVPMVAQALLDLGTALARPPKKPRPPTIH